mgnify:CR=1 FL=1
MPGYVIHLAVAERYLEKHKDKNEDYISPSSNKTADVSRTPAVFTLPGQNPNPHPAQSPPNKPPGPNPHKR